MISGLSRKIPRAHLSLTSEGYICRVEHHFRKGTELIATKGTAIGDSRLRGLAATEGRGELEFAERFPLVKEKVNEAERFHLQFSQLVPIQQLLKVFTGCFQATGLVLSGLNLRVQLTQCIAARLKDMVDRGSC